MRTIDSELTACLRATLPSCQLEISQLPLCPAIKLALLEAHLPQGPLPHDEMLAVLNQPAYWAFCWASGQVLAQRFIEMPIEVRDKVVIDFGAGSGVVGIAAAISGARRVICCDLDADAQLACKVNAELNGVEVEICGDINTLDVEADLLVAADVLYDRENLPLLDQLPGLARDVLIADSRIRHFNHARYERVGVAHATTWPDLDEQKEFNEVKLYRLIK